ncbi:unnamed protein product [Protopolystoma xenopodis]|uniref:Uncharacterized protein n=1 Tax=Protopolystoma xenopodis TaxID=117903 RepID=A0A448WQ20_9PLAT|nr:unnamed protein product [Protopolystoma xenopodis]
MLMDTFFKSSSSSTSGIVVNDEAPLASSSSPLDATNSPSPQSSWTPVADRGGNSRTVSSGVEAGAIPSTSSGSISPTSFWPTLIRSLFLGVQSSSSTGGVVTQPSLLSIGQTPHGAYSMDSSANSSATSPSSILSSGTLRLPRQRPRTDWADLILMTAPGASSAVSSVYMGSVSPLASCSAYSRSLGNSKAMLFDHTPLPPNWGEKSLLCKNSR